MCHRCMDVPKWAAGLDADGLVRQLHCLLKISIKEIVLECEIRRKTDLVRVCLRRKFQSLFFFLNVTERPVIVSGDVKPLSLADPLPQVKRLLECILRSLTLANIRVHRPHAGKSKRKVGIEFSSTLQ